MISPVMLGNLKRPLVDGKHAAAKYGSYVNSLPVDDPVTNLTRTGGMLTVQQALKPRASAGTPGTNREGVYTSPLKDKLNGYKTALNSPEVLSMQERFGSGLGLKEREPEPTADPNAQGYARKAPDVAGGFNLSPQKGVYLGSPGAYGVKGTTGLPEQKGSAPYGLQQDFWERLVRANAAMKSAGLGTFGISDGWRSYDAQVAARRNKGKLAATPGRSVHGIGYAVDIAASAQQKAWLKKNAARLGLWNLPHESWHYQMLV